MPYATPLDVEKRFKNLKLQSEADLAANNLCGEVTLEQVECFIEQAEAAVDLALCGCYCIPLEASDGGMIPTAITNSLKRWVVVIAAFDVAGVMNVRAGFNTKNNSTDFHNQDTAEYQAYKRVLKELDQVRSGKLRLCGLKTCEDAEAADLVGVAGGNAEPSGSDCCVSECYDINPCIRNNTNF